MCECRRKCSALERENASLTAQLRALRAVVGKESAEQVETAAEAEVAAAAAAAAAAAVEKVEGEDEDDEDDDDDDEEMPAPPEVKLEVKEEEEQEEDAVLPKGMYINPFHHLSTISNIINFFIPQVLLTTASVSTKKK